MEAIANEIKTCFVTLQTTCAGTAHLNMDDVWQSTCLERFCTLQWDSEVLLGTVFSLKLKDGLLYKLWSPHRGMKCVAIVLTKQMGREIFTEIHETTTAGHFGSKKTLDHIRSNYCRDIRCWCHICDLCAMKKGPPLKERTPIM